MNPLHGDESAGIGVEESLSILASDDSALAGIAAAAGKTRDRHRGRKIGLCAILNARSGACPEDCSFCAQSAHSRAKIDVYGLVGPSKMLDAALRAADAGAARFGIVTSGRSIDSARDVSAVAQAVSMIRSRTNLKPCASLGIVSSGTLRTLREAGLDRYHHNLETAKSYFPAVCTTRSWSESVDVIRAAAGAGLSTCCGGIFGLGESLRQRVELLESIRDLHPDSVPVNFLNPIPGTRLEGASHLTPADCVRIVAAARLMMPDREIRLCGGRELNLRELQPLAVTAGADGMMIGGYLTTSGRPPCEDRMMLRDAGFDVP